MDINSKSDSKICSEPGSCFKNQIHRQTLSSSNNTLRTLFRSASIKSTLQPYLWDVFPAPSDGIHYGSPF